MKRTIKSVKPIEKNLLTKEQIDESLSCLSDIELNQLGKGDFPNIEEWCQFRKFLEERSIVSNPLLNKEFTAYTPAETLNLMEKNPIKNWLDNIENIKIPEEAKIIAFVPCAKTKPWKNATKGIYKSYNKIINENNNDIYFVTISEPLGIVPQDNWNDFPQYDNPGLFKDVVQRSGGLFTKDWNELFGKRYKLPWDQSAYDKAIDIFAEKIAIFVNNNKKEGRKFISFVGDEKLLGTHQDMVNRSGVIPKEYQFLKRAEARAEPYEYIVEKINSIKNEKTITQFLNSKLNDKVIKENKNKFKL